MEFYSVVLRKKIKIQDKDIKNVVRKGRKFAVGKYTAISPKTKKLTTYEAWRVLGLAKK